MVRIRTHNPYSFIAALLIGAMFAIGVSVWATSVGTNVSVTGTFDTGGNTTLGDASSDTVTLTASTTASNGAGFAGNTFIGDAATDNLTITSSSTIRNGFGLFGHTFVGDAATDDLTVTASTTVRSGFGF
ncbi:MAG: hypothetical protein HY459_04410, partial [Parcubacteria group bacterium]|nr:hypothetical protein [Parcubacteria group bacterium]